LERAANIIQQLGRALTVVHEHGICHRDLKPENVMLQNTGDTELVKIVDFGIAKVENPVTGSISSAARLLGTLYYMSPEQLRYETATAASDIYALGLIAYELLTGLHPFVDLRMEERLTLDQLAIRQRSGPRRSIRDLRPEAPDGLEQIVEKALAPEPGLRYSRARDVVDDLERIVMSPAPTPKKRLRVVLLYKRHEPQDEYVLGILEQHLNGDYEVFVDRHTSSGMRWARDMERQICTADVVVLLLSATSIESEMLAHEVEVARDAARLDKKPRLLVVSVNFRAQLPEPFNSILSTVDGIHWTGAQDDEQLRRDISEALEFSPRSRSKELEAEGGAIPLQSKFYIERPTDQQFFDALRRRDSIVLVKGARQMGKTSLLARGLQLVRKMNVCVAYTDMQKLDSEDLSSPATLFSKLARLISRQVPLRCEPEKIWDPSPSLNFEYFLQHDVLDRINGQFVWALDEVDRLFGCPFASDVFGLFRTWHNARATEPDLPWPRLTMAIAYATEAHLLITNPHQSPFNVGTRVTLSDFNLDEVAELNRRYDCPLRNEAHLDRFYHLLNGQPYLSHHGLNEMVANDLPFDEFAMRASSDEGPFADHLHRFLWILAQNEALRETIRRLLQGVAIPSDDDFYRLRSAGLLSGNTAREARPRCELYADYFARHLL
jgi:hypothetical protein